MAERDSFVFYRSFYECIREMPQKSAYALYIAVCEYALNQTMPELKGIEAGVFAALKPQIDANNKKYENGKKGGRPKKNQDETLGFEKEEPKRNQNKTLGFENIKPSNNQNETKTKPNVNENVNVNDNVNDIPPISPAEGFEQFWKLYPKKTCRKPAEDAWCRTLMSEHYTPNDLVDAAKNYAEACKIEGTEKQFISEPGNFLDKGKYKGYLADSYIKPQPKGQTNLCGFEQNNYDFNELEKQLLSN